MPLSVRLDSNTEAIVNRLAKAKAQTKSQVIRAALELVARTEKRIRDTDGPYPVIAHLIGCVDSGGKQLSRKTGEKFRALLREKARGRGAD